MLEVLKAAFIQGRLAIFVLSAPLLTGHCELFFVLVAAMMGALLAAAGRTVHSSQKKRISRQRW